MKWLVTAQTKGLARLEIEADSKDDAEYAALEADTSDWHL